MKSSTKQAGFTLIELMIAMVIFGVVLTGVVQMFTSTGRYHTAQEMMVDLSQDLRAVKHVMVQELREAGCNPNSQMTMGFQVDTDSNSIHFTRDIDNGDGDGIAEPDGDAGDANENIRYYRTNDNCTGAAGPVMAAGNINPGCLRRDTGAPGGGQPVMANVTEFRLSYYNDGFDGTDGYPEIPSPHIGKGWLADINVVRVLIRAQVEAITKVSSVQAQTQTLNFLVLIRNR
jgi:prepilin-type N-terminal cleavage/methylation domain-containing protein